MRWLLAFSLLIALVVMSVLPGSLPQDESRHVKGKITDRLLPAPELPPEPVPYLWR
jgi:hypothetical protein